jgi:4-amino-4-deoxy-L-arabinose transferase-like glycosyltransferase
LTAASAPGDAGALRRVTRHPGAVSRWSITFALAGIGGLALRVWTYRSAAGVPDSDEAVVGLMARNILHGHFTTFFWGQAYGGSQEALLTAPIFAVFDSSWVALRVVPIALSAVAALLVWRVGLRLIGERPAAVAAAVFWIWPPFLIYKLTHQWGFYASGVVYCVLLLLLGLRVVEEPSALRAGLFGLVLGLAAWETEQIVPVAVPLLVWMTWKRPRWLRKLWIAAPATVVGALPSIVWNIRHDFGSFHSTVPDTTTYWHRLRLFVSPLLPLLLGLRADYTQERIVPSALATYVIEALLAGLFAWGAWRSRGRPVSLLYLVCAVYPFLYAIPAETMFERDPKYLVVLAPVLVLLVAQLARTYPRALALILLAAVVSVVSIRKLDHYFATVPQQPPVAPRDIGPLIATLDRLGLDRVYATYWVAYRIDFDTRERIIAAQNKLLQVHFASGVATPPPNPNSRWHRYEQTVAPARHGFVFFKAALGEVTSTTRALAAHGYRRIPVGPFVVYAPPS